MTSTSRRAVMIGAGALTLAACGQKTAPPQAVAPPGTLAWALAGPWRTLADRRLDKALRPIETLQFFGLTPVATVVEVWPGQGWWTQILGPYLTAGKGKLYAATYEIPNPDDPAAGPVVEAYRKTIADRPDLYAAVALTAFGPHANALAPPGTADLVLFFDLDHWMAAGLAEKAFHDAFDALKSGGVLGVVQARAEVGGAQDPLAGNGSVQENFVKQMATEAGFVFDKSSEINAGPHEKGNAKLAFPSIQGAEPDRMTLRFRKPR